MVKIPGVASLVKIPMWLTVIRFIVGALLGAAVAYGIIYGLQLQGKDPKILAAFAAIPLALGFVATRLFTFVWLFLFKKFLF